VRLGSGVGAPDVGLCGVQVIFRACEVRALECPPDQHSGEVALDLTRSDQAVRTRVLPGKSNVSDQWAREPQLPTGGGHQPRPAAS